MVFSKREIIILRSKTKFLSQGRKVFILRSKTKFLSQRRKVFILRSKTKFLSQRRKVFIMKEYLTSERLKELKKELEYLRKTERKKIADELKSAIAFGDLSENAAYKEAKESQAFLEGRIRELEKIINNAEIIKKDINNNQVKLGSTVTLKNMSQPKPLVEVEKFKILGKEEADPVKKKISFESPLGKSLLNKFKGAVLKVNTPQGKIKYKILKIE